MSFLFLYYHWSIFSKVPLPFHALDPRDNLPESNISSRYGHDMAGRPVLAADRDKDFRYFEVFVIFYGGF
jgi:hypothetical protein